ncbi:Rha family transcriptional regulator [Pantoea sp. Bo_2]|uniref:toxin YdaT family protein n=1 Tax=unclassified Pantoea TaxID=2630326 RepID=UPI001231954E|nr:MULTISPECIES: toxin YdaT family protein [unclassified Pantoea]KAA5936438.1 Rha family transcriptional regulator [Pantoea sp. VH_3]KAA5949698.1 Rha family transcriptional regulator [Pantoea sp. VH_25]KAA5955424.1 Rha family transcriptional regulator [Pantoea sp. VH_24]KAA5958955.1 Rha family transcriptional regulator [Pantoea sp. VH_16]KAA5964153.1 Rha family transcriptional regulator [Pantoea sp. VH_18]
MKIRHEHIRDALFAWARAADGRKVPANAIADAYFALGMSGLLYSSDHPNAQGNNVQKIFRWAESDSLASQQKIQALLPAIEKAMPVFLLARMRSHSSETCRDLVIRKERIDREMEAMIGAIIALSDRVDGSGPAGNALIH